MTDTIEFEVTEKLKKYGVRSISLLGDSLEIDYCGRPIGLTFDYTKLSTSINRFRKEANRVIKANSATKSDIIEDIGIQIISEAKKHYQANGGSGGGNGKGASGSRGRGQGQQESTTATLIMKYNAVTTTPGVTQLWETVKIAGKFCLVSYDPLTDTLSGTEALENYDGAGNTLVPFDDSAGIEHYSFSSKDELEQYIRRARGQTLGTLFRKVKHFVSKFHDTDVEAYTNLIAADIVFTYFQDKIGKTHYIFVWGEPDTGKGAILECFNQLGYRGDSVTVATAASIYRMLGSVEKGQIILIIDEANKLENDDFLLNVLKVGYKGNTKVPRVMDAQSSQFSKTQHFFAFCFKIIAAEKLPSHWRTGGLLSRCLLIHTVPGNAEIDITDVIDNAGDPENAEIMNQLTDLRKLLFAYRLLHYHDTIADVKIPGIVGRDREMIKPLIRLFMKHGNDSEVLKTVKETLHYFIKERNDKKVDSFNSEILKLVKQYIESHGNEYEFTFSDIWQYIEQQLHGEPIPDEPDSMKVDLLVKISKNRLGAVLRALGGNSVRDVSGTKRVWKFDEKTLNRFDKVYKIIPETIEVAEQTTLHLEEEEQEQNSGSAIQSSDTSDTFDTCFDQNEGSEKNSSSENCNEIRSDDRKNTESEDQSA
jgi:hypothetical protein